MTSTQMAVVVPADAAQVATLQREAEVDALAVVGVTVDTPAAYTDADALLTRFAARKDALVAMRKSATTPLYAVIRTVEGWFKPAVSALETCEAHLKGQIATYRVRQAAEEARAREAAARAAETGDAGALLGALGAAAEAGTKPEGGAVTVFRWVVERVNADLLPDEWWAPNMTALEAAAKAHRGDEPPVIPGVVFRREASVRASRKVAA